MDTSDGLGRLFRKLKSGGTVDGLITRQGYVPTRVSAKCIQGNEQDIELTLVLKLR